jgi:hypothetical protein
VQLTGRFELLQAEKAIAETANIPKEIKYLLAFICFPPDIGNCRGINISKEIPKRIFARTMPQLNVSPVMSDPIDFIRE